MADQTKQTMIGGSGNTQIIGVPFDKYISEIRRKDAEITRLNAELLETFRNTSDPHEKDDFQPRLNALHQKRDAMQKRILGLESNFPEHVQHGSQLIQKLVKMVWQYIIDEGNINSVMQAFESFSYDEVMALFQESERLGLVQAASSAHAQGLIEEDVVNWQDALEHYKRAYDLDATLEHQQAYARLCWQMGLWNEAVPLHIDILEQVTAEHGKAGIEYTTALNNLAVIYKNIGRYSDAEPLYGAALSITRRLLGVDHPDTASSLNNLAGLYDAQGRYSKAGPLFKEALSIRHRVLGADHPDTAGSLNNLAGLYYAQGRYEDAESLYDQALSISRRVLGADHPETATSLNKLAGLYRAQGRYVEAAPMVMEAVEIMERVLGVEHPNTKIMRENYEVLLAEMKEKGPE